jgi:hypothetical protein
MAARSDQARVELPAHTYDTRWLERSPYRLSSFCSDIDLKDVQDGVHIGFILPRWWRFLYPGRFLEQTYTPGHNDTFSATGDDEEDLPEQVMGDASNKSHLKAYGPCINPKEHARPTRVPPKAQNCTVCAEEYEDNQVNNLGQEEAGQSEAAGR